MAAKRKTKKNNITLSEFKTWLAGVQSMQPAEWHPSKENWAMILEQIDYITETVVEKEVFVPTSNAPNQTAPVAGHNNPNDPRNPATYSMEHDPATTYQHRQMPAQPVQQRQMPPSAIPMDVNPSNQSPGKVVGDKGLLSVDIPTGDGEYESSFT